MLGLQVPVGKHYKIVCNIVSFQFVFNPGKCCTNLCSSQIRHKCFFVHLCSFSSELLLILSSFSPIVLNQLFLMCIQFLLFLLFLLCIALPARLGPISLFAAIFLTLFLTCYEINCPIPQKKTNFPVQSDVLLFSRLFMTLPKSRLPINYVTCMLCVCWNGFAGRNDVHIRLTLHNFR